MYSQNDGNVDADGLKTLEQAQITLMSLPAADLETCQLFG